MRLVCPTAFKGTLSPAEAARLLMEPGDLLLPLSDGGDGFMDCIHADLGGTFRSLPAADPFGPVLVEGLIGGEPCCLMVDTGAMRTSLSPELVGALGLNDRLGGEASFVLAGGVRLRGRVVDLPSVALGDISAKAVPAVTIAASEVGIDGLLGQSFLKGFIYTVDERRPEKVFLQPRKP